MGEMVERWGDFLSSKKQRFEDQEESSLDTNLHGFYFLL